MAAIALDRLVRLTVFLTISGNRLSFSIHYYCDSAIVGMVLDDFANAWETACLAALQDCLSEEVKIECIQCYALDPDSALPGMNYLSGEVGAITGEALPSNVGAVVQLRQTEISAKHNSRFVLPGIPESVCVNSLLTTTFVDTTMAPFYTALAGPIVVGAVEFEPCVVVRQEAGAPVTPYGIEVKTIKAVRNMGTQRRRTTELREFHP